MTDQLKVEEFNFDTLTKEKFIDIVNRLEVAESKLRALSYPEPGKISVKIMGQTNIGKTAIAAVLISRLTDFGFKDVSHINDEINMMHDYGKLMDSLNVAQSNARVHEVPIEIQEIITPRENKTGKVGDWFSIPGRMHVNKI